MGLICLFVLICRLQSFENACIQKKKQREFVGKNMNILYFVLIHIMNIDTAYVLNAHRTISSIFAVVASFCFACSIILEMYVGLCDVSMC